MYAKDLDQVFKIISEAKTRSQETKHVNQQDKEGGKEGGKVDDILDRRSTMSSHGIKEGRYAMATTKPAVVSIPPTITDQAKEEGEGEDKEEDKDAVEDKSKGMMRKEEKKSVNDDDNLHDVDTSNGHNGHNGYNTIVGGIQDIKMPQIQQVQQAQSTHSFLQPHDVAVDHTLKPTPKVTSKRGTINGEGEGTAKPIRKTPKVDSTSTSTSITTTLSNNEIKGKRGDQALEGRDVHVNEEIGMRQGENGNGKKKGGKEGGEEGDKEGERSKPLSSALRPSAIDTSPSLHDKR